MNERFEYALMNENLTVAKDCTHIVDLGMSSLSNTSELANWCKENVHYRKFWNGLKFYRKKKKENQKD